MNDPLFAEAVALINAGDVAALERLLAENPRLLRDRVEYGDEGYFQRPYLLWFIAENPVRNGRLPANIADVARTILAAAPPLPEQVDYALELVCSGRVPRECRVQRELIDVLMDAAANPRGAMMAALAHRERDAVQHLLERGAELTLLAAVCTDRLDEAARLMDGDLQLAFIGAALYGNPRALAMLIARGVDLNAYAPPGFHPHATALHHAVHSGSLDAVKVLVEAGADRTLPDRHYQGTPLDWADYLERTEIAAYLRGY